MAFIIIRLGKECPSLFRITWAIFAILLLILSLESSANFTIKTTSAKLISENSIRITANSSLKLAPRIIDAVHNGITIHLNYELRLKQKGYLFTNTTLQQWIIPYSIEFHSLSNQYIVQYPGNKSVRHFLTIKEALNDISKSLNVTLNTAHIDTNSVSKYFLSSRIILNRKLLPAPLRTYSIISSSWRMPRSWSKWPIISN